MDLKAIFKQAFTYLLGSMGIRAASFLMFPLYTHYLTPADYGVIELIELATQVVAVTVGFVCVGSAMTRIYYDFQDPKRQKEVISSCFFLVLVIGILAAGFGCLLAPRISLLLFHSHTYEQLLRFSLLAMMLSSANEIILVYQRIRERAGYFVVYSIVQLLLLVSLNIYFIAVLRLGAWGFVWSKLISTVFSFVFLCVAVMPQIGWHWRWEPTKRILQLVGPLIVGTISMFVIHFSDRFFLTRYSNLADIGAYSLAYKFGFLISYMVAEPFGRAWDVRLFAFTSSEGWETHSARAGKYLSCMLFFAALGISLGGNQAIRIIAPGFARGAMLVPLLCLAYAVRGIGDFFQAFLHINKRVRLIGSINTICGALNLLLNFLLIRQWGIMGAAAATLLTWAAYAAFMWTAAFREHRLPLSVGSVAFLGLLSTACISSALLFNARSIPVQAAADLLIVGIFVSVVWSCGYLPKFGLEFVRKN